MAAPKSDFEHRDGATRLARLFHHDPLRVLFPNPRSGDLALGTLVTTSGGLVGGDRLDIAAVRRPRCRGHGHHPGGRKGLPLQRSGRSSSPPSLTAGDGAWMEWLPQEAILFDGARLRRATSLDVAGSGRAMAGELLVFGRTAHGERFTRGLARDAWEVRRDGRLIWADALHLDGDIAEILDHPGCFGGRFRLWDDPLCGSRCRPASGCRARPAGSRDTRRPRGGDLLRRPSRDPLDRRSGASSPASLCALLVGLPVPCGRPSGTPAAALGRMTTRERIGHMHGVCSHPANI